MRRGRYGGSEARGGRGHRSAYDPDDDDELEWEDGGGETAAPTTRSTLNGAWTAPHPGPHRLMAALGGGVSAGLGAGVSAGSSAGGPRTMLHNLLAMTTGGDHHRTFPPSASVSPPVKSPTRSSSSSLKPTTNVAPPCVY